MSLSAGTRLGPYEIAGPLGVGGMGEVYRATDTRLDRTVAIRVLPAAVATDPNSRQRFEREARAVAELNHPHICTIHDVGESSGQPFLVMELLDGETLADWLTRGSLSLDMLVDTAIQVADALDAAHTAGIVHRDLKSANIFLSRRGQTKVLDFGLARLAPPRGTLAGAARRDLPTAPAAAPLTSDGTTLGTVAYMSPEQARGEETGAQSDLFSFGVVLYEMATGRAPFAGRKAAVIFEEILNKTPTAPLLNPAVPRISSASSGRRWRRIAISGITVPPIFARISSA